MKISFLHILPWMMLLGMGMANAQVNFTQTTTSDFIRGTGQNVNIVNDGVTLQQKFASVGEWTATSNMPQSLKGHQMVLWRNYVYIVGGYNGSNCVNTVYRAQQQDNGISGWSTLNALPVSLRDMAVAVTQTHLVVMGGRNETGMSDKIYMAKFNDDGSIGSWFESTATLPAARWGLKAVSALDYIYLIGGATDDSTHIATKRVYSVKLDVDGAIDTIVAVKSLPEARNGHAVAMYDSKIYVTGGYDATLTACNTVYCAAVNLDGTLGNWQTKAAMTDAVYDHAMACGNGVLVVMGGHDGSIPSNKTYYTFLDGSNLSWTLSDVMLAERYSQGAGFAFGNKIFLAGGAAVSEVPNNNVNFMPVTTAGVPVRKSSFVSKPFDVGDPKTMQQLSYTLSYSASTTSHEVLYRMAGDNRKFGDWISSNSDMPAVINQSNSFLQYMFRFTATAADTLTLEDVTLTLSGMSQLTGNLNDIDTLKLANSPYMVTGDISFTSGTHVIEAGVVIRFMPNLSLSIGQASVNFNGTEAQPILLTSDREGDGLWNGVYYQDPSDNGVSSVMSYTTIEKAGNGDNNANLRLHYTNQPTIDHCVFDQAVGHGIRLCNSHPAISNTVMSNNTESGLYLESAQPTVTSCTMSGNEYAGIFYANTNFNAVFSGVTASGNLYGMYSCSPDRSFTFDDSFVAFADNTADIAVAGGQMGSNQTWNNYPNGYALVGNVEVFGGTPKLTLKPGVVIKGLESRGLYIGRNSNQGGMLNAVGTAEQPITFTSLNGEIGGWDGVRFRDGSDYSSTSSMRYCVMEKGTTNLVCESTNQPSVMWCTIQDARDQDVYLNNGNISLENCTIKNAPRGIWVNSATPTLVSVVLENMSEACVYHNNTCTVTYSSCTMKDSFVGVRYETPDRDMVNNPNITFENNTANIGIPGGRVGDNHTWDANIYAILDNVQISRPNWYSPNHSRLTLMPGTTLMFAEGKRMQISSDSYFGELYAEGTAEQPITFTSLNGEIGGWTGLYFDPRSDDFENASSSLKHCIFEKGYEFNLHLYATNQPSIIEDCVFRNSAQKGVYMYDSYDTLRNCSFENNAEYALYYNNAQCIGGLENLTFTGNQYDGVVFNGGYVQDDRIWNAYTYFVLNDFTVRRPNWWGDPNHCRLTLMPGTTMKFAEGKRMQISSESYYGELYAEGTAEQPITFTSMNGEDGGWNGLYFDPRSDDFANASSSLKHCIIEKGNEFNLHLSGTNQPSIIEDCVFRNSVQKSVYMYDSYDTIRNCTFENNGDYPLYYNNAHYVGVLEDLIFTDNQYDVVAVNGGHITDDRIWNAYTYYILENMNVGRYYYWSPNHCRLNLMPGTIIKVAEGRRISIAVDDYCGELYAVGTEEQPILFTSINGEVGGWNGIVFPGRSDDFADPSSLLKYCIFEKGNEYNLIATGTTLPEIEDCVFQNANQYGLRIDNEYCQTIKNSVIRNNGSHGIYITNTTPFTLGGSPEYACSLYDNGGYAVYQDGGSNIDMTYNFWSNIGHQYIDDYLIYDKIDNSSKGRITFEPVCWFPPQHFDYLYGTFVYNDNKQLGNLDLEIIDINDSIVASTTTDANGQYGFNDYSVSVYNTLNTDFGVDILAGVNATDALLTMRHFVHLDTLTDAQFAAADVNSNGVVNGTDAMLILRRTINEAFPAGDFYYFNPNGMTISGDTCHYDLSFLCYGDVNGSYTPQSRNSITLMTEGELLTDSYQELVIPVRIKTPAEMGAITLHLGYPAEALEIQDIVLAATGESLLFVANNGELRTAWYSLDALTLSQDDLLINILIRTNDLSLLDEPIAFTMEAYSELADGNAQTLDGVVIAMPVLTTPTMGVSDFMMGEGVSLSVYPNPANDECHVKVELPEAGRVKVEVYNILGVKVMDAADAHYEAGSHELLLVTSSLASGVYQCRVIFEGARSWMKSNVIIIEK